MAAPSYDACIVEAELRARAAYAAPGRHYHDQRHLDDCLGQLEAIAGLGPRDKRLLGWAILWHDAVYDPRRSDNEARSGDLARNELLSCGVDPAEAEEVARLILLTRGHEAGGDDRLGAVLVSIDLSILGSDSERYRAYVANLRREYAHLPNEAWRAGRAEVLKALLNRDPLYPSAAFHARLEARARRNMQEELRGLAEG